MNLLKNMFKKNDNHGFTLVELIVTIGVFAIVMVQVGAIVANCSKLYVKGVDHVDLQTESQRVLQLTEELMIDATGSISANDSVYEGSQDISIVTSDITGKQYQYDIYLKKDDVSDETGKVYLKKTDLSGGGDNADEVMADYVKTISVNTANYATDDRITVSLTMKSDKYEYDSVAIKDIYLRNDIGSGAKDGDGAVVNGKYTLDVRRYAKYDLASLYGNVYDYEFEADGNDDKVYYVLTGSELKCVTALNTSAGKKTSCIINAYKKSDASKTSPEFTIVAKTEKARVGLGDEGNFSGSAICYGNAKNSSEVTSFADVVGITLDPSYCKAKCEICVDDSDLKVSSPSSSFEPDDTVNISVINTTTSPNNFVELQNFKFKYDKASESYFLVVGGKMQLDQAPSDKRYPKYADSHPTSVYGIITVGYPNLTSPETTVKITVYFSPICDSDYTMTKKFFESTDTVK